MNRNEFIAKYLVDHGVNLNKENKNGKTPLLVAYEKKNEMLINYLVKHGGNINNIEINEGETLLFEVCKNEDENLMKCLIECGADVNKEIRWFNESP